MIRRALTFNTERVDHCIKTRMRKAGLDTEGIFVQGIGQYDD